MMFWWDYLGSNRRPNDPFQLDLLYSFFLLLSSSFFQIFSFDLVSRGLVSSDVKSISCNFIFCKR